MLIAAAYLVNLAGKKPLMLANSYAEHLISYLVKHISGRSSTMEPQMNIIVTSAKLIGIFHQILRSLSLSRGLCTMFSMSASAVPIRN